MGGWEWESDREEPEVGGNDDEGEEDGGEDDANGEGAHHFARGGFFAQQMPQPDEQVDDNEADEQNGDDSQHGGILPQDEARMKFRFRPFLALWAALAVLATGGLSAWQFDRAAQKRELERQARAGMASAPIALDAAASPRRFQRAVLTGRFLAEGVVLIDNRIRGRRPGYDVISPFLLDNGQVAAVNRGWIPAKLDRTLPPIPALSPLRTTIQGIFVSDQSDAVELGGGGDLADGKVLQNLKVGEYGALFGLTLRTTLVLAMEGAEAGLLPPTVIADFRAERSVAYAWQWLTFGLLALVFFILLSRDSGRSQEGRIRNRPLILILLIGAGAPILSTTMYFLWRPDSFTHYGELISPPREIPLEWRDAEQDGKWALLRAGPAACGLACRRELCRMRQLRLMMHGDYQRIARGWVLTDSGAPADSLTMTTDCGEARAAGLRERATEADILSGVGLLRGGSGVLAEGWLYVADPAGLLVMRYPPGADLYKIRKDFRRLLKLSKRREAR